MPTERQQENIDLLDKFREIAQQEYDPHEEVRTPRQAEHLNKRPGKGPWKKNVAAPSRPAENDTKPFSSTPWAVDSTVKPGFKPDPTRPKLGAEWLAWTSGSRPVRGHKTSLKKMGLKGQPKPELAMTEERKENRLSGQVEYEFYHSEGKKVPSFEKFLVGRGISKKLKDTLSFTHRQKLIDLYGREEGRKFWKADSAAEDVLDIKKSKEIWKYAKEYEKRAATKDTKKAKK